MPWCATAISICARSCAEIGGDGPAVEIADSAQSPEDSAVESEGMSRLDDCMKVQATEQRDIVLLAYYQGFTHTEIARRTSTPVGTIKTWLHRSLAQLKGCLEQ